MKLLVALLIVNIVYYELIDDVEADDDCKFKRSHLTLNRLKNDLLCEYEKTIRPKINVENETKVTVKMIMKSFSLEMHSEELTVNSWMAISWQDDHLKWKKEDYDNTRKFHISSDEIWVPDLSVYNKKDQGSSPTIISSVDCQVYSTGLVVAVVPTAQSGLCIPNLRKYPFDTQVCTIRIGSWVHSGEELNITLSKVPLSKEDLTENPEFELVDVKINRNPGKYKCCPNNTFPSLNYVFTIKRYSSAIAAIYVIPATVLIILTLTTLWLNIESSDRICVCCCNLIMHFLYIQNVWWNLPSGGKDTPLLFIYARDSLLLAGITLILTVLLRTMQGSKEQTPKWVSAVATTIANSQPGRILFFFDTSAQSLAALTGQEDAMKIVENSDKPNENKDWVLFAKVLDKLCFVACFIVYLCMVIGFLP